MVQDNDNGLGDSLSPLTATEREGMLGFKRNHTRGAWGRRAREADPEGFEDLRCSLLGNSFAIPVVCWLLGQLLAEEGLASHAPTPAECNQLVWGLSPPQGMPQPCQPCLDCDLPYALACAMARAASHKGSDVRLTTGEWLNPSLWPRQSVPAAWWRWRTVIAFRWCHTWGPEHINKLELRAFLSACRWRARKAANLQSRWLHLLDTQVCLGIVPRGRTA